MDKRLHEYYTTGKYKGFLLKTVENVSGQSIMTHLVFTNGRDEVEATGRFREEALLNIFNQVDRYLKGKRQTSQAV